MPRPQRSCHAHRASPCLLSYQFRQFGRGFGIAGRDESAVTICIAGVLAHRQFISGVHETMTQFVNAGTGNEGLVVGIGYRTASVIVIAIQVGTKLGRIWLGSRNRHAAANRGVVLQGRSVVALSRVIPGPRESYAVPRDHGGRPIISLGRWIRATPTSSR